MKATILAGSLILAVSCSSMYADSDDIAAGRTVAAFLSRIQSRVMVRVVEQPTRALLDLAAYDRNPLLHYPTTSPLQAPAPVAALADLHFDGALDPGSIRDTIEQTPLSAGERALPLAWQPMISYLMERDYDRAAPLLVTGARVSAQRWGNSEQARPLQQIALAFLHGEELWVKVEFRPEVTWVPAGDEDGDGYGEIYARLAVEPLTAELRDQLTSDYIGRRLDASEVDDYFYELCSEWYQSLQTYLLEPEQIRPWPTDETPAEVVAELGGHVIGAPTAVIYGQPYGETIFNVFVLASEVAAAGGDATEAPAIGTAAAASDAPLVGGDWQAELERWGGSYEAWARSLSRLRLDLREMLQDVPAGSTGLAARDGWLFFRGDLMYLLSGDLREQPEGKDPWPAVIDFHQQLQARGVDLLLVIIPTKAEIYPEKLSDHAPGSDGPPVAPYCRKLMAELSAAGVEVLDLHSPFMAQRDLDPEPLYMPQDTHWTPRGLRLAAALISRRVKQYPWYAETGATPDRFGLRPASSIRIGDIVGMLPESERVGYRPMQLAAEQVLDADGSLYVDDPQSPIVMLGDSFTGVFHFEDCKHAGLSAHVARDVGLPVDLIMAQGSGPRIRGQLARRGEDCLSGKRLVVWTMVSRDLHNYWANWDLVRLP